MTTRLFRAATLLVHLGVPLLAAPGAGQGPLPQSSVSDSTIQRMSVLNLAGTWRGSFRLDSAWQLAERPSSRSIAARIHFQAVGDASPTTMSSRSVHPGTFEIDFGRFGFALATRDALGWSVGSDSLRAVLNPAVNHGTVELVGVVRGDTVAGTWRYVSDPGGALGTFVLGRVRSSGSSPTDPAPRYLGSCRLPRGSRHAE